MVIATIAAISSTNATGSTAFLSAAPVNEVEAGAEELGGIVLELFVLELLLPMLV